MVNNDVRTDEVKNIIFYTGNGRHPLNHLICNAS